MAGTPKEDAELGNISTSRHSVATADELVDHVSYGKRLASQLLSLEQRPDHEDKIITFRKLRRYDITRIQHDLLKVYYKLKNENEDEDEDKMKLTSLLRDHASAIRDWDYMAQNLTRFSRDDGVVKETSRLFPEIPWGDIKGMEVAYFKHEEFERQHKLHSIIVWALPREWTWSREEKESRPLAHRCDIQGKAAFVHVNLL